MAEDKIAEFRKWKKAHPDFPLIVHSCGYWTKKVRGKVFYFGVLNDPDTALAKWIVVKDYLLAGAMLTVEELFKAHLKYVDELITAGKLSHETRQDYLVLPELLKSASVFALPVKDMRPMQFAAVQRSIEASVRNFRSQKNVIMAIKSVFDWGQCIELIGEVNYGPRFVAPSNIDIEVEQEEADRSRFYAI